MATKVDNVNSALMLIGGLGDLTSLSQNRRDAQVANRVYDIQKKSLLSQYPWSFTIARKKLTKLNITPVSGMANVFELPPDCLRFLSMEPAAEYTIENGRLTTDFTGDVYGKYLRDMPEGEWPSWFTDMFVTRLASIFSSSLAEDNTKFQLFDAEFRQQRQIAMAIDGSQRPPISLDTGILLRGRRSGRV